jgi:cell division protein FtsA
MHGVRLEVDTHILNCFRTGDKKPGPCAGKSGNKSAHRTVTSLAAAEAVLDRKQKESGVAVVDIGAATTNLVVIEDGEVEHIAVIPMGGATLQTTWQLGLRQI